LQITSTKFPSGLFLGWSLGANDASNVFGTAVGSKMIHLQLFFVGAVAIAVGVFTYSKRVMATVGEGIFKSLMVT